MYKTQSFCAQWWQGIQGTLYGRKNR